MRKKKKKRQKKVPKTQKKNSPVLWCMYIKLKNAALFSFYCLIPTFLYSNQQALFCPNEKHVNTSVSTLLLQVYSKRYMVLLQWLPGGFHHAAIGQWGAVSPAKCEGHLHPSLSPECVWNSKPWYNLAATLKSQAWRGACSHVWCSPETQWLQNCPCLAPKALEVMLLGSQSTAHGPSLMCSF